VAGYSATATELKVTAVNTETYSFSKLSSFHQCKYQYYLTYIEKRKGVDNAFSQYGTFIHSILERHAKGELGAWEMLDAYVEGYDSAVTEPFPHNQYADLQQSYYRDGYDFLKNFDGLDDLDIIGTEIRFKEPLDDFTYTGIIDIVYKNKDGGIVVRDWKSKAKFSNKKEQAEFARQPLSYGLHILNKFNKPPVLLQFFMFRKNNIVNIPFNQKEYDEALTWIRESVKEIRACQDYPASPDQFFCSALCSYRNTCQLKRGET